MSESLEQVKTKVFALLGKGGAVTDADRAAANELMSAWAAAGGPQDDAVFMTLFKVYGAAPPSKSVQVKMTRVGFDFLEGFMRDSFLAYGVVENEAKRAAELLITADKRGIDSHGIGRFKPYYCDRCAIGIVKANAPFTIVKETETTAVCDGHLGLGITIGPKCMDIAIAKAKKFGMGMVVAKNSQHYGAACYYTMMAAEAGMIGITGTNARPSIAPTHGVDPQLGTNPLTWGMPSDDPFPFILDAATSINQRGKIEKNVRLGLPTQPGQVGDRDGRERTDSEQILIDLEKTPPQAYLAPLGGVGEEMGGYKGFGYATVVELLSSCLQDGAYSTDCRGKGPNGEKVPMPLGHWFIAINVESFLPLPRFKEKVGTFLRQMRNSAKDPKGPGRIWTAGEKEHDAQLDRTAKGGVPLPPSMLEEMEELREKHPSLKEKYPVFPWEDAAASEPPSKKAKK